MINYHFFLIVILFITIIHAERARNDNLDDEENFSNTNNNEEEIIETIKRFLGKSKKTTTSKPTSDAISALITTTSSSIPTDKYGKKFNDACGVGNPCKNGGTCRTLPSGRHYCYCTDQYYGRNCEKKFKSTGYNTNNKITKNSCSSSPCLHGGECVPSDKTFFCRCKTPYYGTNCNKRLSKREEILDELFERYN
ncbi:unnamed protein product [Adineta steineri]|uniref:EGF-like domain-containing protein n=1 Tax=Adineta steineri TaxID=433720 RepID=A0A815Z912_9BILA|nr:unnamed protein product [Adineta steineri]